MKKRILILVSVLLAFETLAWTYNADFEQGTVGQKAQGASGFTGAGSRTWYSDELAHTGSKSVKFSFQTGETGFAIQSGEIMYPSQVPYGSEIWVRYWVYQREPWRNDGAFQWWKMFRIHRAYSDGTNAGYTSVYGVENGIPKIDCEMCTEVNIYQSIGTPYALQNNKWECIEFYTKFQKSNGIVRMWINNELKIDYSGMTTPGTADYADLTYVYSYWNGGAPQDQDSFMDDIVITTDIPSNTDSRGNRMIGCGGSSQCSTNWQCTEWSACVSNQQTRTCSDANSCGSTSGRPATSQACDTCSPNWICSGWSACVNSQQTQTCTDSNSCGTTTGRPPLSQSCASYGISVDSTYDGYSTSPIDDNYTDASGMESSTWASEESAAAHWILFTFPTARDISKVDIYWAFNDVRQQYMSSQELQIQYWDGSKYMTAATITNTGSVEKSTATFSKISTNQVRLYQPGGKGAAVYPNVLWVAEVDYGNCAHQADTDCDGCIRQDELFTFISGWKLGQNSLANLMEGIRTWKQGC